MEKEIKLKPCPFCGSTDLKAYDCFGQTHPKRKSMLWIVDCMNCDCMGPLSETKKGVIKLWNTRKHNEK